MLTFVVISDIHFPFQDNRALKLFKSFVKSKQIDHIILNGDILDFYDLSRFDKDPDRINKLQNEINQVEKFIGELRENKPDSKITYILGNHEDRLRRYLWQHQELASLDNLKLERLLNLDKYNVELTQRLRFGKLLFTHGDIVRQHSSYSAKGQLDKFNCSGVSGHTHRLGSFFKSGYGFDYEWYESGCMCDTTPVYLTDKPNWQQGFLYGGYLSDKNGTVYNIYPIRIRNGRFINLF